MKTRPLVWVRCYGSLGTRWRRLTRELCSKVVDESLKKAAYPGLLQDHPHAHEALEYATMNDATTNADALPLDSEKDVLTDVLRRGATQLLTQAIQAEVAAYLEAHSHLRDEAGRQQVVRNGSLPQRTILTSSGRSPPVRSRRRTCGRPRASRN